MRGARSSTLVAQAVSTILGCHSRSPPVINSCTIDDKLITTARVTFVYSSLNPRADTRERVLHELLVMVPVKSLAM